MTQTQQSGTSLSLSVAELTVAGIQAAKQPSLPSVLHPSAGPVHRRCHRAEASPVAVLDLGMEGPSISELGP